MEEEDGQLPLTAALLQDKFSKGLGANSAGLGDESETLSWAPAAAAQQAEGRPAGPKVAGLIPDPGTRLGRQPGPWVGGKRKASHSCRRRWGGRGPVGWEGSTEPCGSCQGGGAES